MKYKILSFNDYVQNANTYLVFSDTSCIVIDPANNVKYLSKYIGKRKLKGIFLTHGHYDHFIKLEELLSKYDSTVYMHKNCLEKLKNPDLSYASVFGHLEPTILDQTKIKEVKNNEIIDLDFIKVLCWYTPGHTDCSMSYQIDDNLFCGDFVFFRSIGRTDLLTGSTLQMKKSIAELINKKRNFILYPGHNEITNLYDEIKYNDYLKKING